MAKLSDAEYGKYRSGEKSDFDDYLSVAVDRTVDTSGTSGVSCGEQQREALKSIKKLPWVQDMEARSDESKIVEGS